MTDEAASSFNVSPKMLAMLGALLLGGTLGGGSISLASQTQPHTAPEVTAALADVSAKLANITVTLAELKTQINGTSRENDKRDAAVADHETRLRRIEGSTVRAR